jgi:SsrA-binding protein
LHKLLRLTRETGFTIIPIRVFINEKGLAKLVIAVAKGKKAYDKRQSLKEKEDKRDMNRMFKK